MVNEQTSAPVRLRRVSTKLWVLIGIVLWLIFVISQIPASWGAWLMTRSGDQLGLSGVTGTIWHGRVSLASVKLNQQDYALGGMQWDLHPLSLLLLSPCADIATRQERQQIDAEVCTGLSGDITVSDADIAVPAPLFKGVLPLPVDGQISSHIENLRISKQKVDQLKGSLSWTGARIFNGNNWMNVGNFAAELTDNDAGDINAKIFDLEGPVSLQLQALIAATGGGKVTGTLSMSPEFAKEANAGAWISMFAQPDGTDDAGNTRYNVDSNL